jgi:hypothetical protein
MMSQRYYPQHKDLRLNEDLRLLYDHMYQSQNKEENAAKVTPAAKSGKTESPGGGPSNTKLTGLAVKGTPPAHGASPFYNQATGQFEYATAAGAVAPPATSSSSGTAGQIAFDGTHIYVCVAANTWTRAALGTF